MSLFVRKWDLVPFEYPPGNQTLFAVDIHIHVLLLWLPVTQKPGRRPCVDAAGELKEEHEEHDVLLSTHQRHSAWIMKA